MKPMFYSKAKQIDHILSSKILTSKLATKALSLIADDISLRNYFIEKVSGVQWLGVLMKENYFSVKKIPFDSHGNALFWNILVYLERISTQTTQNPRYGVDLLAIIEDVVQFSQNKTRINNYQIWWSCVKILSNLPNGIIKKHLPADKFRAWLSIWTDSSLGPITEIGEKLLPKFLGDDSTIAYAEAIIDAITEIKPAERTDYLFNRQDAVFVWDFYWIREAFQKNDKLIGRKCSLEIIFRLADKLKKALEYKWKYNDANIEIGDEIYPILVSRIPTEGIRTADIDFQAGHYECAIMQYSQEQLKKRETNKLDPFFNINPQIELKRFPLTAHNRKELVSAIKQNLPAGVHWEKNAKLEKRLGDIYDGLFLDYSYISIKSLATGVRSYERGVEEVLTIILRDILLAKCEANRDGGRQVLDAFLGDRFPFPVFRRLVLLCIDKFWGDYAGLMDRFLELYPNPLAKSDFQVELYDVLRNHNSEFSPTLKANLKKLINSAPEHCVEKDEKNVAHLKYLWLSPLRDNSDFSALYEDAIKKAEIKADKPYEPERSSDLEAVNVVHKSPLSIEDILQKPVIETVKVLQEFKDAGSRSSVFEGKPDKEGLVDTFQAAVKEKPQKFTDEINRFLEVDNFYIRYLLRGITETWNDNKEIDWKSIFDFSAEYLKRAATSNISFAEQGEDQERDKLYWVIGDIVELISSGCRNDNHAFDQKHFDNVEQIFDLILPLLAENKQPEKQKDALSYAWNTTLGRTIMAYVSFSLRVSRATKKRPDNWGLQKYERFFNKGIEAVTLFGSYLPQMKYLDEAYAKEKIECFARHNHENCDWQTFMAGYLAESRVYKDVYGLMRDNYQKAIEHNVFEKQIDDRLVDHICIGYLSSDELLKDKNDNGKGSLFWKMLTTAGALGKQERWMEAIHYFRANTGRATKKQDIANKDETSDTIIKKIIEFWEWTYNQQDLVKTNLGEGYNAFLGQLTELTSLFDKIDEDREKWLLLCTPHLDQHKAHFFIQSLKKFNDQESVRRIGKIFLKVLEHTTPMFKEEDATLIVRRIYETGDRNDADNICETYGRQGLHFLRPLWEEFHNK